MGKLSWIKLNLEMFSDEKVRLIEKMPDGDSLLVIWIKLLTQAGKTNAKGYIFLNENVPFTAEMLSTIFDRPLPTVRLALNTFQQFDMIAIDEHDFISINNWEKHQSVDKMEQIQEQNRIRQQKYREKQKTLLLGEAESLEKNTKKEKSNVTHNVTVTQSNAIERELEKEKEYIKPSCHKFSISDMENAKFLFELMQQNNPDVKEPNFDKWADGFRLIRERDKRTDKQVKYLIEWSQQNEFWSSNILSPSKLRKQWDQLVLKAKAEHEKKKQLALDKPKNSNVDWKALEEELGDE